jgi:hypothetical protein
MKPDPFTIPFLGFLFGPVGMIVAGLLDARPHCARCGGRQNVKPNGVRYEVCEHCGIENRSPASRPQAQSRPQEKGPAPVALPQEICTTPIDNDPEWERPLSEAKNQLELAELINRK